MIAVEQGARALVAASARHLSIATLRAVLRVFSKFVLARADAP
jgi:hypothetical protein